MGHGMKMHNPHMGAGAWKSQQSSTTAPSTTQ